MFRDKEEELQRLQAQLLEEEQTAETEDFPEEEDFRELLWDTDQGEAPRVYQNYSNNYGKDLRNFASGYQAYNADDTDVDMDEYCDEVCEERAASVWWVWLVIALMATVVFAIGWMILSTGGLG